MDKLVDYICDELEELERKVEKGGKLSSQEVQYMDTLAHAKKNLLKSEEMSDGGYSSRPYMRGGVYSMDDGMSYARGRGSNARRDSMGRYSSRGGYSRNYSMDDDFMSELHELKNSAPNSQVKQKFQQFIDEVNGMM